MARPTLIPGRKLTKAERQSRYRANLRRRQREAEESADFDAGMLELRLAGELATAFANEHTRETHGL